MLGAIPAPVSEGAEDRPSTKAASTPTATRPLGVASFSEASLHACMSWAYTGLPSNEAAFAASVAGISSWASKNSSGGRAAYRGVILVQIAP